MKLDEGGLARVMKRAKDKKQSHATVSAERGDKSKKENKSRSKQLEKDLRGRGYGPKKTTGTYSERDKETGKEKKVKERSYFVTSGKKSKRKFKKDMKKVAKKHGQDSVLVKQKGSSNAKLHATRKGGLGKSKSETAGKLKAKKGEFSTQFGKKHMTYEEAILAKATMTREEIREGVLNQLKKGTKRHKDAVEKRKIKNRKAVPYAALAAEHQPEGEMVEAKVDKGRSDYGKASIRNYRRSGPGHGEPAMFDSENKRGKTIDKRREEHKARRGVKGAKVPAYKVNEHHTKDKDGKVIEHEDTTPSSVEEGSAYGIWKGDGKRKLPGDKKKAKKKEMKEAAPLAAVAAKVAGKVAAKKVVASTAGKAAVRGGIKVGGKSGGKFVKKQATKIVQNKVEKKVNQALGNEQQNEEVSRRSKPSNKAKMAKLDAILKRREERKVLEKQNALKV